MMVTFTISLCELFGDGLEATSEFFVLSFVINGHTLHIPKGRLWPVYSIKKKQDLSHSNKFFCSVYWLYLNNYWSNSGITVPFSKQESIPVGCVPPAFTCSQCMLGSHPPSQCMLGSQPPRTEGMTHACENITLPQTSFTGGKYWVKI